MFCKKCGSEASGDNVSCNNCEKKMLNEIKGNIKAAIVKLTVDTIDSKHFKKTSAAIMLLLTFVITALYFNKPVITVRNYFNNKNYMESLFVYSLEIERDTNILRKYSSQKNIGDFLVKKVNEAVDKYENNKIQYSEAETIILNALKYNLQQDSINTLKARADNLHISQEAYESALKDLYANHLESALSNFSRVIQKDSVNYYNAQKQIRDIFPKCKYEALASAENYYKNQNYDTAIEILSQMQSYVKDDKDISYRLSAYQMEKEKYDEFQKQKTEERKQELLRIVNVYTDPVTKSITYIPAPFNDKIDIQINQVLIKPYLQGKLGYDLFKIVIGLNRSNWIFMDQVICNADGYIFTLNFNYFDRKSMVSKGTGIYEWVEISCDNSIVSPAGNNPNILDDLTKLSNAVNARIQIHGNNNAIDYELTPEQKKHIADIIELHYISKKQINIVSEIK